MKSAADNIIPFPSLPALDAYGHTDKGLVRENNEDSFICKPRRGIFIVADGIGGHAGGEVASELAVRKAYEQLKKPGPPFERMGAAFNAAHEAVRSKAHAQRDLEGMGTTLVSLLFTGPSVTVGHAGDSRAYLLRDTHLHALTRDHAEPRRGYLLNAVGMVDTMSVDLGSFEMQKDDAFLLCSDGLTNAVPVPLIEDILTHNHTADDSVRALINTALRRGGPDNVTVIVVKMVNPTSGA